MDFKQNIKQEEPAEYVLISTFKDEFIEDETCQTVSNGFNLKEFGDLHTVHNQDEREQSLWIKSEIAENEAKSSSEYDPESEATDDYSVYKDIEDLSEHSDEVIKKPSKFKSKLFKCDKCPHTNKRKKALLLHIGRHYQPEMDQCKMCLLFFPQSILQKHIECKHTGQFSCTICSKMFASHKGWRAHHENFHMGIRYVCDICGNFFHSRSSIWDHMKVHRERQKDFKCEKCDSGFYRRSSLNRHVKRKHSGVIVPQKIISKKSYHRRKNRPEGERKFKCLNCGKGFFDKNVLKKHMKIISCEMMTMKLTCDKCNRTFQKLHYYLKHIAKSCKLMYECDYCSKLFKKKESLCPHFASTHNMVELRETVSCKKCNRTFLSNSALNKHMRRVHHKEP